MTCTEDDHDTTDMFCGACGEQLHEFEGCGWCERGQHDSNAYPFCQCCGAAVSGTDRAAEHGDRALVLADPMAVESRTVGSLMPDTAHRRQPTERCWSCSHDYNDHGRRGGWCSHETFTEERIEHDNPYDGIEIRREWIRCDCNYFVGEYPGVGR